jgi:hypothetical protein
VSEKMFSREQYEQLRPFPEIRRDELFRYFTLTPADAAFVDPGAGRGPSDRLGIAVQLATLPWLGFVPDDVASAPPAAVGRLAERLGLDPGAWFRLWWADPVIALGIAALAVHEGRAALEGEEDDDD